MNIAGPVNGMRCLTPGVMLCVTVAMAAAFLSAHYGAPVMLFALLLGMAFNFVEPVGKFQPGVTFASKTLLRLGVALLGARVTLGSMTELGILPLFLALAGVILTMGLGIILARFLGYNTAFGVLTGGAVGICGASAALALSSVLPRGSGGISERDTIFTVVSVTTLSTVAMVAYPIMAKLLGFDDTQAGIFIGATVHDVAQVVGAGFSISDDAGNTATIVKLIRVAMLVPVIAGLAFFLRNHADADGQPEGRPARFPTFLIGFIGLMIINSFGLIPPLVTTFTADASRWFLVIAIAGLGTKTSLGQLVEIGPRAAAIIVIQTLMLALFAVAALVWWP